MSIIRLSRTTEGKMIINNSKSCAEIANKSFQAGFKQHHIPKSCKGCQEDIAQWKQEGYDLGFKDGLKRKYKGLNNKPFCKYCSLKCIASDCECKCHPITTKYI